MRGTDPRAGGKGMSSDYKCNWKGWGEISKGIPVGKNQKQKKGVGTGFNVLISVSIFAFLLRTSVEAS